MKFAVWILVITALLSLAALLIEEFFPLGTSAPALISFFQLGDPFRSWWFTFLLFILAISLTVCILKNGPMLVRQAFTLKLIENPDFLKSLSGYRHFEISDGENRLQIHFRRYGLAIKLKNLGDKIAIAGRSGGLSRLGPLFSHTGMLLLIVGGLSLNLTGYNVRISGATGEKISLPEWDFSLLIDNFELIYYPISLNQWVELPDGRRGKVVELKNDSARVDLSAHGGLIASKWLTTNTLKNDFDVVRNGIPTPYQGNIRSYITSATVMLDDKALFSKKIEVNHPLRFRGYRFYQSSFEPTGTQIDVDSVYIRVTDRQEGEIVLPLQPDGPAVDLPWGNLSLSAGAFYTDFKLDRNMQPFSASGQLRNPAVRVTVFENDEPLGRRWVFTHDFDVMRDDAIQQKMRIEDLAAVSRESNGFITVLDVRKESGSWLIWLGFLFATIGLTLTYIFVDRRAWAVVLKNPEGDDTVHFAVKSKNSDRRFQQLIHAVEKED